MLYSFNLTSDKSVEKVVTLLASNVSERPIFGYAKTLFYGKIAGTRFSISRVVHGTDTFNPLMRGSVVHREKGCLVRVHMTLHPIALIIMIVWPLLVAHGAAAHGNLNVGAWIFALMPWIMGIPLFSYDVRQSRRLLEQCLKADPPAQNQANQSPQPTPLARRG